MTPLATSHSDQELVAAVRRGSAAAFEELYGRYSARIRAYVLGTLGDRTRADDVTQEVFISALRGLRGSEVAIAFKPWIYGIAKNACIDEFRRTRRRGREVPLGGDPADELTSPRWLVAAPSPDVAVEEKQQLSDLRSAFGVLSASHHRVIVMRELEGLSYSQIGERLGMSQPVVESTLFRARRQLGAEYDEVRSGRRCGIVQTEIAKAPTPPWKSLGLRQRRRLTRHLAHCEALPPCRPAGGYGRILLPRPDPAGEDRRAPAAASIAAWAPWRRAPETTVTGSLRWRRDRWGRERCRRSMRSGTQAVHWAGSGGRPWLPPLRQRYWRGRGPGWWSGSVAPPARLTIRTLRLLLWDLQSPPKQPDPRAASPRCNRRPG